MKTMNYIGCLWVVGILCAVPAPGPAQTAPFTRITTGPIVSDGGDSYISNWADYDEDGDIDLVIGNTAAPPDFCSMPALPFFYLNQGNGNFRRATTEAGCAGRPPRPGPRRCPLAGGDSGRHIQSVRDNC